MNNKVKDGQYRIYRFHFDSPAMRWIDRDNFIEEDPFHYEVDGFEQAVTMLKMLKAYDDYQQKYHGMEPDSCDCYGLEIYLNGEWVEWKTEDCENIQAYIEGDVSYVLGENA